jgi:hypothetical protein
VGDYACVRGGRYFRFYWQEWSSESQRLKTKHVAIRGGNTANAIAQRNAQAVRDAIAADRSNAEIVRLIRSHKAQTGNYKRTILQEDATANVDQ